MRRDPQDAAVKRWLQGEVAPVYYAKRTNPERELSAEFVLSKVRARYSAASKASS
jgi:hypothetical protein